MVRRRKASQSEKPALALPTEKSAIVTDLAAYSTLIYGTEKVGKTSFAAEFDDPLFFFFEPGGKSLSVYGVDVLSWGDFKKYITMLRKSKRYKTAVVDTVDLAYEMCEDYVCKKFGFDHPSDEEWGKGWKLVRKEFQLTMTDLVKAERGTIFISHAKEVTLKRRRSNVETQRTTPTMSNAARAIIEPMVDIWAYYDYMQSDSDERQLTIRGNVDLAAGTRLTDHFLNCGDTFSMGSSPQEAYQRYLAAFNNEALASSEKPSKKKVAKKKRRS